MIKEAFGTGSTINDAYADAKSKLDAPENAEIQYEVVEHPKAKVLGLFGGAPAKVRAFFEVSSIQDAIDYLVSIVKGMGVESVKATYAQEGSDIMIDLDCGDDYGVVIGRRGETLDAIQYLTRLAANRISKDYIRVSINIGNYREKREKTLRELAAKNAAKVLKYGRNVTFEPMNPYERRIIHTAIQEIQGVTSHSVGADTERRVVISLEEGVQPTNPSKSGAPQRGGRNYNNNDRRGNDRRGGGNGYRGGRPSTRPESPKAPQREPRTDEGAQKVSLYGKIN